MTKAGLDKAHSANGRRPVCLSLVKTAFLNFDRHDYGANRGNKCSWNIYGLPPHLRQPCVAGHSSLLLSEANAIAESRGQRLPNWVKPTWSVFILAVRSVRCDAFEPMIWLTAAATLTWTALDERQCALVQGRIIAEWQINLFGFLQTVSLSLPFSLTSNQERPLYESFSIIHSHREEPLSLHIPATPQNSKMPQRGHFCLSERGIHALNTLYYHNIKFPTHLSLEFGTDSNI